MQSIEALKEQLRERKEEINSAVEQAILDAQKLLVIVDSKNILFAPDEYGSEVWAEELQTDLGIHSQRLMQANATVQDLKDAIYQRVVDCLDDTIAANSESGEYALNRLGLFKNNLETWKKNIDNIELTPAKDVESRVIKIDDTTWVLISNGQKFLYETKAIGAGDNGSVHAVVDAVTGDARVVKLQYGRMDITPFEKTGRTFSDDVVENAMVVEANGQEFVITGIDEKSGMYQVDILLQDEDDSSNKYRSTNDPIFLKEINGKFYNFEFVAQVAGVVQKEHEKSINYKPNGQALGIERAEIFSDNATREFLEHVLPVPEKPVANATIEEHEQYELKLIARQLLLDRGIDVPVHALVQNFIPGYSLDRLMAPKNKLLVQATGSVESKAVNAVDFALLLINSITSMLTVQNGGEYHSKNPNVQGIYHRDIRPGNLKFVDGRIIFIDLGAAVEFEQDRVAVAMMGQTEGYTHPEITSAIDQNLGREVKVAYAERHEAYTMLRLVEDYLKAFVVQNPDTADILNPIISILSEKGREKGLENFEEMKIFMEAQKAGIRPAIEKKSSNGRVQTPKERRYSFKPGSPVSAKMQEIIDKLSGVGSPAAPDGSKQVINTGAKQSLKEIKTALKQRGLVDEDRPRGSSGSNKKL